MKVVILAGGFGTRISEESHLKPKPMVDIGEKPILWHIMKIYSHYGYNDFVICLGYKGYLIKEYFAHYFLHDSDVTFNFKGNAEKIEYHKFAQEQWSVTLVETGTNTMTGGRIKRIKPYIGDETFMLTYGDGVADVNIQESLSFHKAHRKILTVTAIQPPGRFGSLNIAEDNRVTAFTEKPKGDKYWVNGGFFVAEPGIFDYLEDDGTVFEKEPLEKLADEKEIVAYHHSGFWFAMDTARDKKYLDGLWGAGEAPWKIW